MINVIRTSFVRPNNATPYTAGDAIGTGGIDSVLQFEKAANQSGLSGYIIGAQLISDMATMLDAKFRLWLFSDAIITVADNDPFNLGIGSGGEKLLVGYIDFEMNVDGQGASVGTVAINHNVNMAYKCQDQSLYGVLTAAAAYVPRENQKFYIKMFVDQF